MEHAKSARRSTPARIALKVDVNSLRGTELGVPRLVEILLRHKAGATFLFNLGPDHTGRAITHVLRPGVGATVRRGSIVSRYGLKALLYGTLLPGPDIGKRCADGLRKVRDAGFETGIRAWDRIGWQHGVCGADAQWTAREMQRAHDRYQAIFSAPPRVHGAAGWQMNIHSYRLTQRLGFDFCSDTRGSCPYIPVIDAEIIACPQIPTTLPTFAELMVRDRVDASIAAERILRTAAHTPAPAGHVFSLQAEVEGLKFLAAFERLLTEWRQCGIELLSLGAYLAAAGNGSLPRHRAIVGTLAEHDGNVALQGPEFLPHARESCV